MAKRKLSSEELIAATKGLYAKRDEVEWTNYQITYINLMLKTGLEMNYKKNVRDFKQNKHEYEQQLQVAGSIARMLEDQIRNGVEIKKPIESKKEDK